MYCPDCGAAITEGANSCAGCGADLRGRRYEGREIGGKTGAGFEAESGGGDGHQATLKDATGAERSGGQVPAEATSTVPATAVAIDIPCPSCGKRPIEEVAIGHRINGFLVGHTRKAYQLIGCHPCLRRQLWWMSAKNLVFGWWGLKAALWNLVFIFKNVTRGAINRGPNANMARSLEDVGVTFDYLEDPNAFDAPQHTPVELYARIFVRLGAAMMFADGEGQPEERRAIRNSIQLLFPGYPDDQLDDLIARASQTAVDIERVAGGLAGFLDPEGQQLALEFLALVARAGGVRDEDLEMMIMISQTLDLDDGDVEAAFAAASLMTDVVGTPSVDTTMTETVKDEKELIGKEAARWYRKFRASEPLRLLFNAAKDNVDEAIEDLHDDTVTVQDGSVKVVLARRENDNPDEPSGMFVTAVGHYDFDSEALIRAELKEGLQAAPHAGQGSFWEYQEGEIATGMWVS